jgi:lysophospholipase L1-like esterase
MRRLLRFVPVFLLLCVGLVASGLILEAGVVLLLGEQPKFPRHVVGSTFGLRINEPGANYRQKSADVNVRFRINQQGMRADHDFAYEKPPGTKRIVSLGDSFTAGYEVEGNQTFSSILERDLADHGYRVEVLNTGVSGYGTAEEDLYLERELFRYSPDLVLVSFCGNDLVDNVRTGLFHLDGNQLVGGDGSYVPAGRLGDFLNTNVVFNFLSEYSNAFVLLKEQATRAAKREIVQENLRNLSQTQDGSANSENSLYERQLTSAILERLYRFAQDRGIPLVVQSIPTEVPNPYRVVEMFPLADFNVARPGLEFLALKPLLDPYEGHELLYNHRSHGHWTPFSHAISGHALAQLIMTKHLLGECRGTRDCG